MGANPIIDLHRILLARRAKPAGAPGGRAFPAPARPDAAGGGAERGQARDRAQARGRAGKAR